MLSDVGNLSPRHKAAFIAQIVKILRVLIVGEAHGVRAHFAQNLHIFLVLGCSQCITQASAVLVTCCADKPNVFTVEPEARIRLERDFTAAEIDCHRVATGQYSGCTVQIRVGHTVPQVDIIGAVGYGIAFGSGSWLPGVLIGYVLGQFATLPIAYYGILFIMNICTYNEMLGMPRMDGSSGILSNFAAKLGGALGAWITGVLLSLAGYISAEGVTEQPASALMMIRIDFAIVPAVLVLIIGLCCLAFSKLEKQAAEFEAEKKNKETTAVENA